MLSILITSFNEPKTIGKAIEGFVNQNIKEKYELIIIAPDRETLNVARKYRKKYRQIKIFKDPGKGKSYSINWVMPKLNGRVLILSDGDVYVSENSVNEILKLFESKKVGCVSGQPVSVENKKTLLGYWSHMLCHAAHKLREKRNNQYQFLECSGYLWAFKNNVIKKFPIDVAEDSIIPIMFWLKGYKIKYAPKAKVYVSYPKNLKDFIKQKRRAAGAHENIDKYVTSGKILKMKTLFNEIFESYNLFFFPKNIKEFFYTVLLFPIRLYIWLNLFYNSKIRKRKYTDAWKRVASTK